MAERICYTVTATLPDESTAQEYIGWLKGWHVDDVIEAGAHTGIVVRLDRTDDDGLPDGAVRVLTQYIFSSRQLFERYLRESAPALRAEGLKRFGPASGREVSFSRTMGQIV